MIKELLGKVLLSADTKKLGQEMAASDIVGAEVVGRGTIVVDGKVIASSKEFKQLKEQARKIVNARNDVEIRA